MAEGWGKYQENRFHAVGDHLFVPCATGTIKWQNKGLSIFCGAPPTQNTGNLLTHLHGCQMIYEPTAATRTTTTSSSSTRRKKYFKMAATGITRWPFIFSWLWWQCIHLHKTLSKGNKEGRRKKKINEQKKNSKMDNWKMALGGDSVWWWWWPWRQLYGPCEHNFLGPVKRNKEKQDNTTLSTYHCCQPSILFSGATDHLLLLF